MAMPQELVIVRHGLSEANVFQKLANMGRGDEVPPEFYERYDWEQPLAPEGILQAQKAGEWITANVCDPLDFDRRYSSKFIRARQTALHIGGPACKWYLDDRIKERDWGIYGYAPHAERGEKFPHTERARIDNPWYARYDGGESLADNVLLRVRDFIGTLHRELEGQRVLVVAHGETMWTMRALLEKMLPEEYFELDQDKSQKIRNGSILQYSHTSPKTNQEDYERRWMRITYPEAPDEAPNGGNWIEVPMRREFSGEELAVQVDKIPRLLPADFILEHS